MTPDTTPSGKSGLRGALAKAIGAKDEEMGAIFLACSYFFFILSAYYVIRPIREQMAVAGGVRNIPWLFTGTLIGMLLVHPLFTWAVSRWTRRTFVTITYRFFMANLVIFFLLLKMVPADWTVWIGRGFFIWTSVFNLFVVSVFWSFMTDIFREGQSKRLFGFIGVGGTLGGILGSSITAFLATAISPVNLLWFSVLLLEGGVFCVRRLDLWVTARGRHTTASEAEGTDPRADPISDESEAVIGGAALDGIKSVFASPYLLGIGAFMLLFTIGSTFLYQIQADIVSRTFTDAARQTSVFAQLDLAVNVLTLFTQAFLTGRLLKWLGVGLTLSLLPLLSIIGFAALGVAPVLAVFVVFQVLRRGGNYAVGRPTREVLYTVLPRADKYKAKNFNDTFVYRAGDQVGAWSYAAFSAMGLTVSGLAFGMVPLAGVWLLIALWLGAQQKKRAEEAEA